MGPSASLEPNRALRRSPAVTFPRSGITVGALKVGPVVVTQHQVSLRCSGTTLTRLRRLAAYVDAPSPPAGLHADRQRYIITRPPQPHARQIFFSATLSPQHRFKACYQSGGGGVIWTLGGGAPPCGNALLRHRPDEVVKKSLRSR